MEGSSVNSSIFLSFDTMTFDSIFYKLAFLNCSSGSISVVSHTELRSSNPKAFIYRSVSVNHCSEAVLFFILGLSTVQPILKSKNFEILSFDELLVVNEEITFKFVSCVVTIFNFLHKLIYFLDHVIKNLR